MDMASLNNLLSFLEAVFNGGSDFNEPIKRCLDRMAEAEWANSDILLVSDGELRQPGPEVSIITGSWMHLQLRSATMNRCVCQPYLQLRPATLPVFLTLLVSLQDTVHLWFDLPLTWCRSCGSCRVPKTSWACACTASLWGRLRRSARTPPC